MKVMATTRTPFGEAWLYSFPFWIIVDTDNPPQIAEAEVDSVLIRAYPPFRSGTPTSMPMPGIDPHAVPWMEGSTCPQIPPDSKMVRMTYIPLLVTADGKAANVIVLNDTSLTYKSPEYPMDSLRLDVAKSWEAVPDFQLSVVLRLLQNLRVISGQWWIGRSTDTLLGYLRNVFEIDNTGSALKRPSACTAARTTVGFEQPINGQIWSEAINMLSRGDLARASRLLLLDSYYHAAAKDYRTAVLSLAQALEQETERSFACLWPRSNSHVFKRRRVMRGSGLPDYLTSDLQRLCGKSLVHDLPGVFEVVEDIWLARGNIAHGHPAEYYRNRKRYVVDNETIKDFAKAADDCINWLLNLCEKK